MGKIEAKNPKDIMVIIVMIVCVIYIINPTAGIIEVIPDNFPVIGNLDEGVVVTLFISCLSYFGYNFGNLFNRK